MRRWSGSRVTSHRGKSSFYLLSKKIHGGPMRRNVFSALRIWPLATPPGTVSIFAANACAKAIAGTLAKAVISTVAAGAGLLCTFAHPCCVQVVSRDGLPGHLQCEPVAQLAWSTEAGSPGDRELFRSMGRGGIGVTPNQA